jgi:hypothetical protein
MKITVFVALLFVSTLATGVAAAQPARFDENGVNTARVSESTTKNASVLKRASIDRLSPKHDSRPRSSETTAKNASAIKRASVEGLSPKRSSRPRRSEAATKNASAIKRVSVDGPFPQHALQQHSSESSENVCVIKRISIVGLSPEDIPVPEPELLSRQAAPDCEFKSAAQGNDEVALRAMKLDYEQQCYRQSESILRARMEHLQDAVRTTIEALHRRDRTSAQ